jgi:hypothetical protein
MRIKVVFAGVPILSGSISFPFLLLASDKTFLASSILERAISHLNSEVKNIMLETAG